MSRKRFTDADKWEDGWFGEQTSLVKLFWLYLLDRCDNAGVWEVNWRLASFHLGSIDPTAMAVALGNRIHIIGDGRKWFVAKFVTFQYGPVLKTDIRPHMSVLRALHSHGIDLADHGIEATGKGYPLANLPKGIRELPKGYAYPQDKDKDKDKEQEQDKDKEQDKDSEGSPEGGDGDAFAPTPAAIVQPESPKTVTGSTDRYTRKRDAATTTDPAELSTDIPDEGHWRMLRCQPWALALIAAGCKIGPNNFRHWMTILVKYPQADVVAAAHGVNPRWPDHVEAALTASRGQSNPGDVVAQRVHRIEL